LIDVHEAQDSGKPPDGAAQVQHDPAMLNRELAAGMDTSNAGSDADHHGITRDVSGA
jgi:hypothetical protein